MDIGYAIGSVFWGFVASKLGYANVFLIASFVQVTCVVLAVIQLRTHTVNEKNRSMSQHLNDDIDYMGMNGDEKVYEDI